VDALSVEAKAALRTGLGAAGGTISIVDGNMRNTDIRKVGSISAEGVPGALTDLEQTLLDDSGNGEVMARGTLTASTLTLYGARLKQANANTLGMNLWLGGYSPWYNGHCEHLDGTPVAGALFSSWDIYDNTQLAGSTGSDGNVSLRPSWHYAGCLDFGFINADGYLPQAHREGGDVSTRYISSRGGTIENCREIGEPRFSMGGYVDTAREDDPVPGFGKDWAGFGDGRVYFDGPENTRCTGAVYYSTPKTVQACQFKDVTGWTVTPAGAATFSLDAEGYVKVTTTGACSVKRNLSNVSLKSYRYCDLYYDSSDGGDLGVKLNAGQREYKVNGSRKYLDLIAPVNINGVDTTVAGWQMTDPSWGYGVWSVSDIEITGLRPGHTYTLKGLVKRRTTLTIRIDDGPFVGDTMGHARLGDPPSLWTVTAPGTGQDGHIRGRKGVVYHDNLPIAEIIDMEHYMVPAEPRAFWMHEPLKFNDELNRTIHPVDSPVTFGIHNAGGREWMTGDREVAFLERGIYTTEGDTLLLPWKVTGTSLKVPFGFDLLGLAFTKKFRGRVVAKIFQQDGTPAAGGYVTAILRKKAGGTIVGNWTEGPIGPDGSLIMLARPQATSIARICTGIAGNVWTTNIDPSESLVGHTIGFGTYPRGKPILAEIAAQNGNQITISWAPEAAPNGAPQASPEAPLTFYVVMPYALDIEVTTTTGSKTTATVELRNRLWYPVTIKADGPVINKPGLIYEPAVNGQLGYTPASSDQLECVP
jgi:hypothetical protein